MLYLSIKRIALALETPNDWQKENPQESLKHIYTDNFPWLEHYILQNSGTKEDAGDVFQEALAAAWLNLRSGKFTGNRQQFNAYLRQICKYKWINELRSGARKKTSYTDNVPEEGILPGLQEDDLERTRMLNSSLGKLGDKCREVLQLFYYKKKSMAEIANSLQNTEDSVKTIKYRCMMQLRKYFLEEMRKNGGI